MKNKKWYCDKCGKELECYAEIRITTAFYKQKMNGEPRKQPLYTQLEMYDGGPTGYVCPGCYGYAVEADQIGHQKDDTDVN